MRRREFLAAPAAAAPAGPAAGVKALVFDVFGTVVDWRGSIIHEGAVWGRAKGLEIDWARFAHRWRAGYGPAMDKVRQGLLPWTRIDTLHRMILDELLEEFRITGLTEHEKMHWNLVWHRLAPWPDSRAGLEQLRERYIAATLSNGNISLLVDLARFGGLAWDAVLSAELFRRYKPDREVYLGAADLLGLKPEQVMMVAAHTGDLAAARACGLRTAFVSRPLEYGRGAKAETPDGKGIDVIASDLCDLAAKLG